MSDLTFNSKENKLFSTYPGLRGAVTGRIHWANQATEERFGTTSGKNPRAYHTCVYAAFIALEKGADITRQYFIARNSSNNNPTVRATNLHNAEIGLVIGSNFHARFGRAGQVDTTREVAKSPSSPSVLGFSSTKSGEAEAGIAITKISKTGQTIAELCFTAYKKGQLKTNGY